MKMSRKDRKNKRQNGQSPQKRSGNRKKGQKGLPENFLVSGGDPKPEIQERVDRIMTEVGFVDGEIPSEIIKDLHDPRDERLNVTISVPDSDSEFTPRNESDFGYRRMVTVSMIDEDEDLLLRDFQINYVTNRPMGQTEIVSTITDMVHRHWVITDPRILKIDKGTTSLAGRLTSLYLTMECDTIGKGYTRFGSHIEDIYGHLTPSQRHNPVVELDSNLLLNHFITYQTKNLIDRTKQYLVYVINANDELDFHVVEDWDWSNPSEEVVDRGCTVTYENCHRNIILQLQRMIDEGDPLMKGLELHLHSSIHENPNVFTLSHRLGNWGVKLGMGPDHEELENHFETERLSVPINPLTGSVDQGGDQPD